MSATISIIDLNADHPRIAEAFAVLTELRPHLTLEDYVAMFDVAADASWTSTVALVDDAIIGIANWRLQTNTAHGFGAFIDDLCTTATKRSTGVGKALSDHVIERARKLGCNDVTLTSGNQRVDAHRFYLREGYADVSKVFRYAL